jgi:hypothetical protein
MTKQIDPILKNIINQYFSEKYAQSGYYCRCDNLSITQAADHLFYVASDRSNVICLINLEMLDDGIM